MTSHRPSRLFAAAAAAAVTAVLALGSPAVADPATGSIAGTLTSAAGAPIVDVSVSVHRVGGTTYALPDRTDADGRYTITGLEPGTYQVEFWVERNISSAWYQWAHRATDARTATKFTVAAGQEVVVDEVRFPTGSLALTYRDKAGQPITSFCGDAVGVKFLETGCTDTGVLVLEELPAGRYAIRLDADGVWGIGMPVIAAGQVNEFAITAR